MKTKEFLKSLAELAASLRQVIEAEVDGFDASPKAIAARRAKVFDPVGGYEYFVNTYFRRLRVFRQHLLSALYPLP